MIRHTVLVVDDEPASLRAVQRALAEDHRVLTAGGGPEALQVLAGEVVALIVADQRMPGMSGTEFLARSALQHPDTIRILLTGYTDIETVIGAINDGQVYYYLTKPWEPHELQLVVRRGAERYEVEVDRKRLLREYQQASQRAQREAEQKGRLLTMAAHELGTPLHVLLNALDLLENADLAEPARSWLQTAQRNCSWLARGLAQMTTAARAGSDGGLRVRRAPVSFAAVWSAVEAELASRIATRRVEVVADVSPTLPPILGDETWLRHALASVASNAVRFTPDGGRVEIRASERDSELAVSVRDTGNGIARAHLDEIFEPFSAAGGDPFLHTSGTLAYGARGLGLGLAITRAIVTAHGGAITVESEPNVGSCFTMTFRSLR